MATSVRSLVSSTPIAFMRERFVQVTVSDCKPNTRLYVFFDGEEITHECIQKDGLVWAMGAEFIAPTPRDNILTSDQNGVIEFTMRIEGGKYTTGQKEIIVADVQDLDNLDIIGNTYGSATAVFTSRGTIETYQTTVTNIITIVDPPTYVTDNPPYTPPATDPLAQSFFTYSVSAGVYVTAIELYFQAKDTILPVSVELREMINGYPAPYGPSNKAAVVSLTPDKVSISNDSTAATVFRFEQPVYLPENREFCFVVAANTNNYAVWTSKMGERSLETGYIIHDQPYVGSIFKSQNNSTWTAEQFEDIKFKIYRANFKTNTAGNVTFAGSVPQKAYPGTRFTTKAGSNLVLWNSYSKHGQTVGSELTIGADAAATYNGIPGAKIHGERTVTRIIDDYNLEFSTAALTAPELAAVTAGKIFSAGLVSSTAIVNKGTGYVSAPTVVISAPTSGTTATATAEVYNGSISRIIITNPGSGYTSNPTVIINAVDGGVGALVEASVEAVFNVTTNKPVNVISSRLSQSTVQDTTISATYRLGTPEYGFAPEHDLSLTNINWLEDTQMVASRQNEFSKMGNLNSFEVKADLISTNSNVSPVIDIKNGALMSVYANAINNQAVDEDLTATISSSGVVSYTLSGGGSGYVSAPTVTIIPAETELSTNVVAATASATISGGVVTAINLLTAGSGYTQPPTVVIASPGAGTVATAQAHIANINSELKTIGNAQSRYLTKKISLANPSTAIKLTSYIYSTQQTTVDWYIRTSLAGDATAHEDNSWKLLQCDTPRNKSDDKGVFYDYEFILTDIPAFDTYDLKCVMCSSNAAVTPYVRNYRVIVAA